MSQAPSTKEYGMTLRDFKDSGDKHIISMVKGTDRTYDFYLKGENGSVFNWDGFTFYAEGRYSMMSAATDFVFDVQVVGPNDAERFGRITLPAIKLSNDIRESRVYFKVYCFHVNTGLKSVVAHGEIWLVR
jgi:hypothetical protein